MSNIVLRIPDLPLLRIAYPTCSSVLHGWPYDIHSYVDVAPLLASAGYRVIVPYLRGYGTTRFLSSDTVRNGQQSVVAVDIIALMDALKIEKATIGGFDWGGADGRHHRGAVARALQGAGLRERLSDRQPGSRQGRRCRRRPSCNGGTNIISPPNAAGPATTNTGTIFRSSFGRSLRRSGILTMPRSIARAASFDNPDHVAIVIHNYRWRLGLAEGEAKYDDLEKRLAEGPVITVPTITLEGDANGAPHPEPSAYAKKFSGKYSHRLIKGGVGHNLPQEAPQAFAEAIVDVAEV